MSRQQIKELQDGSYRQYIRRKWMVLITMIVLTVAAGLASLMAGSAGLSLKEVVLGVLKLGSKQTNTIVCAPWILPSAFGHAGNGFQQQYCPVGCSPYV